MDEYDEIGEKCLEIVRKSFHLPERTEYTQHSMVFWWRYFHEFYQKQKAAGMTDEEMLSLFKRKVEAFLSTK